MRNRFTRLLAVACLVASCAACSSSRAILLELDKNVCVIPFDRVEVEVILPGPGDDRTVTWSSDGMAGFLENGPETIAIAVDRPQAEVRVEAYAYVGDKVVAGEQRSISLEMMGGLVEERLVLDGCECNDRDYFYCEDFDEPLQLGWVEGGCDCPGGTCESPFEILEPADRLDGDAMRLTVGLNGIAPDVPCTLYRDMPTINEGQDFYFRAFIFMEQPPDPGWDAEAQLLALWGSGNWWELAGGFQLPAARAVSIFQSGSFWELLEPVSTSLFALPVQEWFCMELMVEGGAPSMLVNGISYPLQIDGTTMPPPAFPSGWTDLQIEIGTPNTYFDASGWVIWYDELAFDTDPIPCPDPDDL